jgi:hypothetical protein
VKTFLTTGEVADALGAEPWMIRRLFERGLLPPAARIGTNRAIESTDLPRIKQLLIEAGYLSGTKRPRPARPSLATIGGAAVL